MELHELYLTQFLAVLVYHTNIVGSGSLLCDLTFRICLVEGDKVLLYVTEHRDPQLIINSVI